MASKLLQLEDMSSNKGMLIGRSRSRLLASQGPKDHVFTQPVPALAILVSIKILTLIATAICHKKACRSLLEVLFPQTINRKIRIIVFEVHFARLVSRPEATLSWFSHAILNAFSLISYWF